jgi:hypothetical protein
MPPVPPGNRPKGPGAKPETPKDTQPSEKSAQNLKEQGRHGNIRQNTTHQGYQQDR